MGWSCSQDAGKVLSKISNACYRHTGSSNVYYVRGEKYFFEPSRTEHNDGAITGTIWKFKGENHAYPKGSFRIDGNGHIARMPKALKAYLTF